MRFPRFLAILTLLLAVPFVPATAAQAVCSPNEEACAGEALQACGGPSAYGDGWDGFTGVWGNVSGVEYGVGGWDRCYPDSWSAGAFVNMDDLPTDAREYETVQARFDWSPSSARPCYLSGGAYGFVTLKHQIGCPDEDTVFVPVPNPGWGSVLP